MPNPYFQFKQFTIHHDRCSMKVTTDSCLFGAWVATQIKALSAGNNILDIGSGSGLLSLMMAQQTQAFIEGVEIQASDYQQSLENISGSAFKSRIMLHHKDVLQMTHSQKYDAIVSNPPFYENDLKGNISGKNIAHHDEGLKLPDLLQLIAEQLNTDGSFYLLLPARRLLQLQQLVPANGLFLNEIVFVQQTEKHEPFRVMIRASFQQTEQSLNQILIKENGIYSAPFTELLKDYYLHL